jgi:HK97 family phage prohead protease
VIKLDKLKGYAAVFNQFSSDLGGFKEIILPGAFRSVLDDPVHFYLGHNPDFTLAYNRAGSLRLWEDKKGLAIEATPYQAQWISDLIEGIRTKNVTQMSFAFKIGMAGEDDWDELPNGEIVRTIVKIGFLYDVTCTPTGAYSGTEIHVIDGDERSTKNWKLAARERELELAALSLGPDKRTKPNWKAGARKRELQMAKMIVNQNKKI